MESPVSYWEQNSFLETDILIVGSGIVGLNAAIALKKKHPNQKVTIAERGVLPSGASTKNAGFACFGSLSEMIEQEKNLGTDAFLTIVEKRWKGLQTLLNTVGHSAIQYEHFGGYEIFSEEEKDLYFTCIDKMDYFNKILKDLFKQTVFQQNTDKISEFGFKNIPFLIENPLEAQLHPGKMIQTLMQIASSIGVQFLNSCEIENWNKTTNGYQVKSNFGTIKSKYIAICTNAFASKWFPHLDLKPGRGQIILTEEVPGLKWKGTFHFQQGYYYFRNVGKRVLIGGGRNLDFKAEETHDFGETTLVQHQLNKLLKEHIIPKIDYKISHKWSGIMAFGLKQLPIIEKVEDGIFVAVRCNGMGIAIGSQTGIDLAELIHQSL